MKKYIDRGKKDTRSGFGEGLLLAGKADPRVVALTADLKGSLKMDAFAAEFPDRYYECGIAEANMIGVASGMAITGLIPFAGSFAEFVTGRVYDQVRMEVCYGKTNVKLASSHAGITLGEDGATHQTMEDIALMRALPDMVVLNPCDWTQTKNATIAAARYNGPVYLRFGRPKVADFMPDEPFEIGKAYVLNEGKDVSIIATGHMVWEALKAEIDEYMERFQAFADAYPATEEEWEAWEEILDQLDVDKWLDYEQVESPVEWLYCFRLPGNVYAIYELLHDQQAMAFLIPGEERALLLDTCVGLLNIREVAESLTDLPITVLNSHDHFDHIGGVDEIKKLTGAPVGCYEKEMALCNDPYLNLS